MHKLPLTIRLALMLVLPLVGLTLFSLRDVWQTWSVVQSCARLRESAVLLTQIGQTIHELQKERGRSATFLSSRGATFAKELPAQRQGTDAELAKLKIETSTFDASAFGTDFTKTLTTGLAALAELPARRAAIDAFSLTPNQSTDYYTAAIAALAEIISAAARQARDVELASQLSGYVAFIQAKEHAGLERATLSKAFATGRFMDDTFLRWRQTVDAQDVYLRLFTSGASPAQKAFHAEAMRHPAVETVARLRQTAVETPAGGEFGVNPSVWFDAITAKIDLMKRVEDHLASGYQARARDVQTGARRAFAIHSAVAGVILVLTAFFSFLTIRSIARTIKEVISNLLDSAERTLVASAQVSTSSQGLAQGASEQAASLEESSAALEEMTSITSRNAESSQHAKELAGQARLSAEAGASHIHHMQAAMAAIQTSSNEIAQIVRTIDELAFQTNILALNAAIEAAHAGNAGFACVADEVRSLAQRSAASARETAHRIESATQKSEQGIRISNQVAQSLEDILAKARQVDGVVAEIAEASQQQRQGITQISAAVMQIDSVTQANAGTAEETATAAAELHGQAENLQHAGAELRLLVDGRRPPQALKNAGRTPHAAPVSPFSLRRIETAGKTAGAGQRGPTGAELDRSGTPAATCA